MLTFPFIALAGDLSHLRIPDGNTPATIGHDMAMNNADSFLDASSTQSSKNVDGCDCPCNCVPGTHDCSSCACIHQNPVTEEEDTAPAQKLLEEKPPVGLSSSGSPEDQFDFIVAGFPKCGTTTLLKAFTAHSETDMAPREECAVASPGMPDLSVLRKLDETVLELSALPNVKRSFKCPTAVYNHRTISRMEQHSPNAKFIVGVRHPVLMLQSYYNYRVTEIHNRHLDEEIPSFEDVISADLPWKGVSLNSTRFELFLMQFGKTDISPEDLTDFIGMKGYQLGIRPNRFLIFLYSVDQLDDEDEVRSNRFRMGLESFLDLKEPLAPLGHENKNHLVGKDGFEQSIDICSDKYADIRVKIIKQAVNTATYLRKKFIRSRDVVIANKEHFVETLESWSSDPCVA